MAMQITIHRGTKEIGGNCVELGCGSSRIIADLGMPLVDSNREPFEARALEGKTVDELLHSRLLPHVAGLFDQEAPPAAILLSHAHLDHVGLLSFSRDEIPVYATTGTSKMMLAGALFARQKELPRTRFRKIKSGKEFTIDAFTVTPYAVDHSAYGSVAFLIEAAGKRILYSGDLRRHGRKPTMMQKLVEDISKQSIDALIIEGTHLGSDRTSGIDEFALEEQLLRKVREQSDLILAAFSPADVDRLLTYWNVARRAGRVFVSDVYSAFVMHLVAGDQGLPDPVRETGIRIFYPQFFERRPASRKPARVLAQFEPKRIRLEEILAEPQRYLMVFRPSMLDSDFESQLPDRACCTYSGWGGYLDREDWQHVKQRLEEANGTFIHAHTSGHIYLDDLRQLIETLRPKLILPIHTFEPQLFKQWFSSVKCLNDGETISL